MLTTTPYGWARARNLPLLQPLSNTGLGTNSTHLQFREHTLKRTADCLGLVHCHYQFQWWGGRKAWLVDALASLSWCVASCLLCLFCLTIHLGQPSKACGIIWCAIQMGLQFWYKILVSLFHEWFSSTAALTLNWLVSDDCQDIFVQYHFSRTLTLFCVLKFHVVCTDFLHMIDFDNHHL